MRSLAYTAIALLLCLGCAGSDGEGSGSVEGANSGSAGVAGSGAGGMGGEGGVPGSGSGIAGSGGTESLCEDVCAWPTSCLEQFAPTLGDADCVEACEVSAAFLGTPCLRALNDTVVCLGTCNDDELTDEDIERCDEIALRIDVVCE